MKNRSQGFSLIEVLIGISILSVAMVMTMLYMTQAGRSIRGLKGMSSHADLIAEVKIALDTTIGCTTNFKNIKASLDPNAPTAVEVQAVDSAGNKTTTLAKAGMTTPDGLLTVQSVDLYVKADLANKRQLLILQIGTQKTGDAAGSQASMSRIPILASVDDLKSVTECQGSFSSSGVTNIEDTICSLMTDGEMMYDPVSKKCVPRYQLKCFAGTAYTATCAVGTAKKCSGYGYALNGVVQQVERKYQSSNTQWAAPPDVIGDISGNTCTCDYATEVEITASTYCEICCAVDSMTPSP